MIVPALQEVSILPAESTERPLRVCLVTEAGGGGVGRHFLDLAHGLANEGLHVVSIHSPRRRDALFQSRLEEKSAAQFLEMPMHRSIHPLDAISVMQLARLMELSGPFDVIHGHSSKGGALARMAARKLRIPSIYTPHAMITLDPTLPRWKRGLYGRIERWLARRTAAMIAVSDGEANHFRELKIDDRRIHIVPNGIRQPHLRPRDIVRKELQIQNDEIVIGFVGRLTVQKAPDVMIDAIEHALARHPRLRLLMIGSGPLEMEVLSRVQARQLNDRVTLLGDVVATDFMAAFDIFCLSSRYEGMPYVYLEALAAGLPIVSTPVGGAANCVKADINGLTVPCNDASALADALVTLGRDEDLRRRYATASLALSEQFTLDQMIHRTIKVYRHVLATIPHTLPSTS